MAIKTITKETAFKPKGGSEGTPEGNFAYWKKMYNEEVAKNNYESVTAEEYKEKMKKYAAIIQKQGSSAKAVTTLKARKAE